MQTINVYHFHNGSGGGVLTLIRNLVYYSQNQNIENHVIYTINKDELYNYNIPKLYGAASEQLFYYSPKWNFYYTCRQLSKLISDKNAVIIAHDWIELGMCSNLGLSNPLIFFLHGDYFYYYDLAIKHNEHIDKFLCVSSKIKSELQRRLPIKYNQIALTFSPVPKLGPSICDFSKIKCAFIVNKLTDKQKQFSFLPEIDRYIKTKYAQEIEWFIVGGGMTKDQFYSCWQPSAHKRIHFFGQVDNDIIGSILSKTNVFILPSLKEGLPISVIEAMLSGNVPIVGSWANTTDNYITHQVNGVIADENSYESFAYAIANLIQDKKKLRKMSVAAEKIAKEMFSPEINTNYIEGIINEIKQVAKHKLSIKIYGSRLDHPLIPNFITSGLRSIIDQF